MDIYISLSFDAAHRLPHVPPGHKCGNLHGHTFNVEVHMSGPNDPETGWVFDFGILKKIAAKHVAKLDHSYLNDIKGLENPTSENIAIWLWKRLEPEIVGLAKIVVKETPTSAAVYTGEK